MTENKTHRREFLIRSVQVGALGASAGLLWNLLLQKTAKAHGFAPRPPGALDGSAFDAACSKCGLCVNACPYETLKLAKMSDAAVQGTPFYAPREIPCYMCRDIPCVKACPTGALTKELTDIKDARMGIAVIDESTCLAYLGLRCEVCYRDCPIQNEAITIKPIPRETSRHAMFVPRIDPEHCTGCGICVHSCPTDFPAINIFDRKGFVGKLGDHYRLGWKEADDARRIPDAPMSEKGLKPEEVPAGGLDYLNGALK
jgi:ferredoxin-type protein NapG